MKDIFNSDITNEKIIRINTLVYRTLRRLYLDDLDDFNSDEEQENFNKILEKNLDEDTNIWYQKFKEENKEDIHQFILFQSAILGAELIKKELI